MLLESNESSYVCAIVGVLCQVRSQRFTVKGTSSSFLAMNNPWISCRRSYATARLP